MLSIIGNAIFTATRSSGQSEREPGNRWAGRFTPPSERMDENRRFNAKQGLFW